MAAPRGGTARGSGGRRPPAQGTGRRRLPAGLAVEELTAAGLLGYVGETDFQANVTQLAELSGWWVWHDTDSRMNRAGLPDLILIRPPRVVFAELKSEKGRLRPAQRAVLELLDRCPGVEAYTWRPSDWEAVKACLARG